MSRFASLVRVELFDEFGGLWRLLSPLEYASDLLDDVLVVPEGFVTDFASVPRLPFMHMLLAGKGHSAAVIHDWMYSNQKRWTRAQADAVFAEALQASGYTAMVRGPMWFGVRIGGWVAWREPNNQQPAHVDEIMANTAAGR